MAEKNVPTRKNNSNGQKPSAQPARDPEMKKTDGKSKTMVEPDTGSMMEDPRAFGLTQCTANHYFHFSYGSCNLCGQPAVDNEIFPVPTRKRTVLPSPLPNFDKLSVASVPRDSDSLDDYCLTKCKEGHLYHKSWKTCHYCANAQEPVWEPEPDYDPEVSSEKTHFNPFQKARDGERQVAASIKATGWHPGPPKYQPTVFKKSQREKQHGGPGNSRAEFRNSYSHKPLKGTNPIQGDSGNSGGDYPPQGGSGYGISYKVYPPTGGGSGSGRPLKGHSQTQGGSGLATPSTDRQPIPSSSKSTGQNMSEESVKAWSGQNTDNQPAGSASEPEPQRPVPKPRH